jgi:hypothetical protein
VRIDSWRRVMTASLLTDRVWLVAWLVNCDVAQEVGGTKAAQPPVSGVASWRIGFHMLLSSHPKGSHATLGLRLALHSFSI